MTHIGKQYWLVGQVLEDLHCERPVHVGLGGRDDGVVLPVPVVRIIEKSLGDVHCHEVISELRLGLDAHKV